jgi:acetylornithine deacetylase/succinyl-diaminopimelate desuccinylase-like protein
VTEVTELLQRLIRVDTTNPPGSETAAAELLRDYLAPAGVECELVLRFLRHVARTYAD